MKVCLVKTSSMGDIIHTLPALTDAKRAIPDLEVDWVVEKAFCEIPLWHAAVKRVIPLELRRWRKSWYQAQTWREWAQYKAELQAVGYDAIIDAQGLIKSALFATSLATGEKFGYDRFSAREGLSALFYNRTFNIAYQQHAVTRIRQLFAAALNYPLPNTLGDYGIAKFFPQTTACPAHSVLAIHATTRADKHWQETRWIELFDLLANEGKTIYLPWGNAREKQRALRLAENNPNVQVLPKMTLSELAAFIANVESVVSVDTGLSHLTAALDKHNVVLYGATDPKLIGAYGKNQHYIQASNMAAISAQQVFKQLIA